MQKIIRYIMLFGAVLQIACSHHHTPSVEVQVKACAVMPVPRASAASCALDGKGYVFGGRDEHGNYLNDLWQYDPATDRWTNLGAAPLKKRVNATMLTDGTSLFIGLGYAAKHAYNDSCYRKDWWQYTPSTKQWKPLAGFPSANTVAPVSYCLDDQLYVLYGCGHMQQNEVWQYTIATETWTQLPKASDAAPKAFGCTGAEANGVAYFGLGFNSWNLKDWYRITLPDNTWTACTSLPGKGREFAACTSNQRYIYLFGGRFFGGDLTGGEVFESFLRYSPDKDAWEWCGTMPCGRAENQIAFTIGEKVYFGLGEDENGKVTDALYRIDD